MRFFAVVLYPEIPAFYPVFLPFLAETSPFWSLFS